MNNQTNCECCKIDSVVTVDQKGQIVLPKGLRERANIKPNDKLAVIGTQKGETVCCIVLLKADALGDPLKRVLGPIFEEAFCKGAESE